MNVSSATAAWIAIGAAVAAVLALIAANDPGAVWVQTLVYLMVAITVASGADYFLNFRRKIEEAAEERRAASAARQRST